MTRAHPCDPAVTDALAAELTAFLDGRLPAARQAAVAARVADDAALAGALQRRRTVTAAIGAAIAEVQAPPELLRRLGAI